MQRRALPVAVAGAGRREHVRLKTWLVTVIWSGTFAAMVFGPPTRPQPLTRASAVSGATCPDGPAGPAPGPRYPRLRAARLTLADRTRSWPVWGPGATRTAGVLRRGQGRDAVARRRPKHDANACRAADLIPGDRAIGVLGGPGPDRMGRGIAGGFTGQKADGGPSGPVFRDRSGWPECADREQRPNLSAWPGGVAARGPAAQMITLGNSGVLPGD